MSIRGVVAHHTENALDREPRLARMLAHAASIRSSSPAVRSFCLTHVLLAILFLGGACWVSNAVYRHGSNSGARRGLRFGGRVDHDEDFHRTLIARSLLSWGNLCVVPPSQTLLFPELPLWGEMPP